MQHQKPQVPQSSEKVQIYELGDGSANFAVFEGSDRLLSEFRLLSHSIHHPKANESNNDLPALPVVLMPEQAQVLLEHGFAQLVRISKPEEGHSDAVVSQTTSTAAAGDEACTSSSNNGCQHSGIGNSVNHSVNDEQLRYRARQMVIGRKIKARKRAMLEQREEEEETVRTAKMLKVRRLDQQKYASELLLDDSDGCSTAELEEAMTELSSRETEKRQQRQRKSLAILDGKQEIEDHSPQPQFLAFASASSSALPVASSHSAAFPRSVKYATRLTVFRDLWRKGFYLDCGAKFGCDFLAYQRPPSEQHSSYMVLCQDLNDAMRPLSLIATSRASTQVNKRILLAMVSAGAVVPYYLEINWWKGDGDR